MGKLKFTFTNIFFWAGIIFSVLIFENISFFQNPNPGEFMNPGLSNEHFFMFFTLAMVCYVALIVYESVFNKTKFSIPGLIALAIFLGSGITGILLFNGMSFTNGSPDLVVTDWDKIKHILSFVLFALTLYNVYFYFNKNHPSLRRFVIIYIVVILVVYFFCIYSVVTEYDKYVTVANLGDEVAKISIKSLFLNENMFAGFILMGICAAIALNYYKKNLFSYISIIGFATIQIFVLSLTSTIITYVITFLYFLFEVIVTFKKHKNLAIAKLALFLVVYITVTLFFIMCQTFEVGNLSKFARYVYRELSGANFDSFSNRTVIWSTAINVSNKDIITLLFGYGFRNSEYVIGGSLPYLVDGFKISCHNGYLQLLVNFGVVGLVVYASLFGYYFYCLIRLFKRHTRFAFIYLVIGLAYFALAVTESLIAFNVGAQGILIGALFYLPVINKFTHLKNKTVTNFVLENTPKPFLLKPELVTRGVSAVLIILMGCASSLFALQAFRYDHLISYILINVVTMLGIAWLIVPYLCGLWARNGKIKSFVFHFMTFAILVLVTQFGLFAFERLHVDRIDGFYWAYPISLGIVLLAEFAIYNICFGGSFKLYLNTFIAFKNVIGSFIGLGMLAAGLYFAEPFMFMVNPITITLIVFGVVITAGVFKYVVPFKDLIEITYYFWVPDLNLIKHKVVKDQLKESYEL